LSSAEAAKAIGQAPAKKKTTEEEPSESGSESSSSDRKKKKKKRRKKKRKKLRKAHMDRGPFGTSAAMGIEKGETDDISESSSDFRKAPSSASKQLQLVSYAHKHPGRLAARLLQKMALLSSRGEGATEVLSAKMPAAAMIHFLSIQVPQYFQKMQPRTRREIRTLCHILDQIARGEVSQAADVICQRLKGLERFMIDSHWNRAQYLELIPPDDATLIDRDEDVMMAREAETDMKIRDRWGYKDTYRDYGWENDEADPQKPWISKGGKKGGGKWKGKGDKKGKGRGRGHPEAGAGAAAAATEVGK
jgi:hypothetical protein